MSFFLFENQEEKSARRLIGDRVNAFGDATNVKIKKSITGHCKV